jgi:site-specific recombinase XerD
MASTTSRERSTDVLAAESVYPQWFSAFMADRAVRKPSPHTAKAYRQDFAAIANLLVSDRGQMADLTPADITKDAMRAAFAAYAETREPATIRRCWSTWNTLCAFLQTSERMKSNPMPAVGRPKLPRSLPKGLSAETVAGLLKAIDSDGGSRRRSEWPERDRALLLTGVLAGLRADELIGANVGDIRIADGGGVIHVRGKGNKDRRIPVEQSLLEVLECYLDSRAARFAVNMNGRAASTGMAAWPVTAALFVGSDGERITRGVLQYRLLRAFKKADLDDQRPRGALVHGLRHTYATELANSNVSVYALMKLLGHESIATSQRYVDGAGTENRKAAALNPLYGLIHQSRESSSNGPPSGSRIRSSLTVATAKVLLDNQIAARTGCALPRPGQTDAVES